MKNSSPVKEDPLHLMIQTPVSLRKILLNARIDINLMLKDFLDLKSIRNSRDEVVSSYLSLQNEIKESMKKIEFLKVPSVMHHDQPKDLLHELPKSKKKFVRIDEVSDNEVEALKAELEAIEYIDI
jgi:hypothetical protein